MVLGHFGGFHLWVADKLAGWDSTLSNRGCKDRQGICLWAQRKLVADRVLLYIFESELCFTLGYRPPQVVTGLVRPQLYVTF